MEEKKSKQPFRAGFRLALAFFIGYNLIYPMGLLGMASAPREYWGFVIAYLVLTMVNGQLVFGLVVSILIGIITRLIFKHYVKNELSKTKLNLILIPIMLILVVVGFFIMESSRKFFEELMSGKETISSIDTNGDGIPDKWVHDDIYTNLVEIDYDTNGDGKPDVWEYYKKEKLTKKPDGKFDDYKGPRVYKRVIDTDFDGEPDKTELINNENK